MITGATVQNAFAFNGTLLSHQPTEHHWISRGSLGVDGNGVEVYVAPRQYEMKWDFLNIEEFSELNAYFLAQGVTGSVVASLPKWNGNQYQFYAYSGCIVKELEYEGWFENFYQGTRLLIIRINGT